MSTILSQWQRQRRSLLRWLTISAAGAVGVLGGFMLLTDLGRVSRERADFTVTVCVLTLALAALMAVARHWKCPLCEGIPTSWKALFLARRLPEPVRCGSCRGILG